MAALVAIMYGFAACGPAAAQAPVAGAPAQAGKPPASFVADEAVHEPDLGTVTATGNVEITQGERILRADKVIYNERVDTVTAIGNVTILEPDGKVLFADYVELFDEMKNGIATGFRMLFEDNTRLASMSSERFDGNLTRTRNAVYSPCDLCPTDPKAPPLWQLRGVRVNHDQEAKSIIFKDLFLEFKGIPVLYTPYFRIPDPTVTRQSGFLFPTFNYSDNLGFSIQQPYYQVVTPSIDLTLAPIVYSKVDPVVTGEYRQRTSLGEFHFDGSITRTERRDGNNDVSGGTYTRGHIRGEGRFKLDPEWRAGFDVFRSSDETYLRRYDISKLDTLTSSAYVEGFRQRSYASLTGYSFQDLRPFVDSDRSPFVLPQMEYSYIGEPIGSYGYGRFDAGMLNIYRPNGVDTRRLSSTVGWNIPYIGRLGEVINVTAQVRGDAYWIDPGLDPDGFNTTNDGGTAGRIKPLVALDWRYPLVQAFGTVRHVIEPIVSLVATPYGGNPQKIPNEDSRNLELDDTNIFSINRFPGRDRYDGGPRIGYGFRTAFHGASGGYTELLAGQSYRTRDNDVFPEGSGLENKRSDYVARLLVSPSAFLDVVDRVRLDADDLSLRRHETAIIAGPPALRLSLSYAQVRREETTELVGYREFVTLAAYAQLTRFWRVSGVIQRDLREDYNPTYQIGAVYFDECLEFSFLARRQNTSDRDIPPSYDFGLQIKFKNLG